MTYKDFVAQATIAIAKGLYSRGKLYSRGEAAQYISKDAVTLAINLADTLSTLWRKDEFFTENE